MYDRTALVDAATRAGDRTYASVAMRLGIPRNTAWRLWHGRTAPSARLAAAVEEHYGVTAVQLVVPTQQAAA